MFKIRIFFLAFLLSPVFSLIAIAQQKNNNDTTYQQLNLFGDVFEKIRAQYVEEPGDDKLVQAAIDGMLSSLDPHSSYLTEKDYKDMQIQTRGEFGGLGIEVSMENGIVKVISPIDDTPAARAGVQPGDLIISINKEDIYGLTLKDAVEKLRGPVDSKVTLTIKRGDQDPFDLNLVRASIKIQSVRSNIYNGDIGYVRLTSFTEQSTPGLTSALKKIQDDTKGKLKGLVLDLRNNPGGLLDQAISVSDTFLDKGEIVSTRGRDPQQSDRYNAKAGDLLNGLPLVVLINDGSASASEIVAGALQDHQRAVIMGTKSFGKGSVQNIIPIPGHGAIRLTTQRYYTPSGRSIQLTGIEPDIKVEQARIESLGDPNKERHEASLRGALNNPNGLTPEALKNSTTPKTEPIDAAGKTNPDALKTAVPSDKNPKASSSSTEIKLEDDYQLMRAVDLLEGLNLFQNKLANKSN
ncbi:MAG: S41 family peptidase [Alphaproteobacteria bacterium]|nr:S41 family peptidase [Alphaproteobacteria bacterium]